MTGPPLTATVTRRAGRLSVAYRDADGRDVVRLHGDATQQGALMSITGVQRGRTRCGRGGPAGVRPHPRPTTRRSACPGHRPEPRGRDGGRRALHGRLGRPSRQRYLRRSQASKVREADDDKHFHGAWKGGAKASGGRPMTKAEARVRARPEASGRGGGPRPSEGGEERVRPRLGPRQPGLRPVPGGRPAQREDLATSVDRARAAGGHIGGPNECTWYDWPGIGGGRVRTAVYHGPDGRPVGSVTIRCERGRPVSPTRSTWRPDSSPGQRGKGYGRAMYEAGCRTTGWWTSTGPSARASRSRPRGSPSPSRG